MPLPLLSVTTALLGALSLSPSKLPANGNRETVLTVDKAAMVHLVVASPSGTSCEVIDHQRGPFASAGAAGRSNCDLDLLLDAGVYKIRTASSPKGRGHLTLKAEPFAELNDPLRRLEQGRVVDTNLKRGQKASWWLHLDGRKAVNLRVSGRTAGEVRLWRGGEWVEEVAFRDVAPMPKPGQGLHEWWLSQTLEAGDYLLTAYGTNPVAWTKGPEEDRLQVAWDLLSPGDERTVASTLPFSGVETFVLPTRNVVAVLDAPSDAPGGTTLTLGSASTDGLADVPNMTNSCRVEARALIPRCAVQEISGENIPVVAVVRGTPGTRYRLAWAPYNNSPNVDGSYGPPTPVLGFRPPGAGEYLVGMDELPLDRDAAPMGCVLELQRNEGAELVASDFMHLSPQRPFNRPFNYDGNAGTVWFHVDVAGKYKVTTSGDRGSRCELFRFEPGGKGRLSQSDERSKTCKLDQLLNTGDYELALYGGSPGIEKVRIAADETPKSSAVKTSCLLPRVYLADTFGLSYRFTASRPGDIHARGLVLRRLPLALEQMLPVVLDPGATLELQVAAGEGIEVRGSGSFSCALDKAEPTFARDGLCALPAPTQRSTLVLRSSAPESLALSISRAKPPPKPDPELATFNPVPAPFDTLVPDKRAFYSFDRDEAHALAFDVKEAGLYHVTTEGLLATECRIRTPIFPALAQNQSGGRGRNCLVAQYLRPGRYLVTARTVGQSKGRAAIVLTRRPIVDAAPVSADGEVFFRADAGALLREALSIPKSGTYRLDATVQAGALSCRLDDAQGWPVAPIPTPCSATHELYRGKYFLTALPLTVESMRHTRIEEVQAPLVLEGDAPHDVALNTLYAARLGKDGKDEFRFALEGDLDVRVVLTNGMQGRLYRQKGSELEPVDVIPPEAKAVPPPVPQETDAAEAVEPAEQPEPAETPETPETNAEGDGAEASTEEAPPPAPVAPPPQPQVQEESVASTGGKRLNLTAGKYVLVTEHSQADVAISYALFLGSDTLVPGLSQELGVPSRTVLKMPVAGVLRLKTRGETDVRCRLLDARGRLVLESADNGADWNCAVAEPLAKGDYTLVLESQIQRPGRTTVMLSTPTLQSVSDLAAGQTLSVGKDLVVASVPKAGVDEVQEVSLTSLTPFSCALEDPSGAIAFRSTQRRDCSVLLRNPGERWVMRVWTLDQPAQVKVNALARRIGGAGFGRIAAGTAAKGSVDHAGFFETGAGVYCLPDGAHGLFKPCGPAASLEAGAHVFSVFGAKSEGRLALSEKVAAVEGASEETVALVAAPRIQTQRASGAAIQLLEVRVPYGERSAPACALTPGTRALTEAACFAASGVAKEVSTRLWASKGDALEAKVIRRALPMPEEHRLLSPGEDTLSWSGEGVRLGLPQGTSRVELTVAPGTWVVQLDEKDRAIDLCPPADELSRCVLTGEGGQLVVRSPETRLTARVLLLDPGAAPSAPIALSERFELFAPGPGSVRFTIPAAQEERELAVEGGARCVVSLRDGTRLDGCRTTLPGGQVAELTVLHDRGPLRALVFPQGWMGAMRFGVAPASAPKPLEPGRAAALTQLRDVSLTVKENALVHLRADSGVCGLYAGANLLAGEGLDAGCEIHRLLKPGSYRFSVRPFAAQPLAGALSWTFEPVRGLEEGVGPEAWIAPDEVRLFRFDTQSQGKVGLGLQETVEALSCSVLDDRQRVLGEGCQQLLSLEKGSYLLAVRAPRWARPMRFRPVLVGLAGARMDVPEEYLREFFNRVGEQP